MEPGRSAVHSTVGQGLVPGAIVVMMPEIGRWQQNGVPRGPREICPPLSCSMLKNRECPKLAVEFSPGLDPIGEVRGVQRCTVL